MQNAGCRTTTSTKNPTALIRRAQKYCSQKSKLNIAIFRPFVSVCLFASTKIINPYEVHQQSYRKFPEREHVYRVFATCPPGTGLMHVWFDTFFLCVGLDGRRRCSCQPVSGFWYNQSKRMLQPQNAHSIHKNNERKTFARRAPIVWCSQIEGKQVREPAQ